MPGVRIIDLEGGTRAVQAETTQVDTWEALAKEVQSIVASLQQLWLSTASRWRMN